MTDQKAINTRIEEILHLADLDGRADEPVKHFSGGMCRRLGIGRALLNDPSILLLDEPTLGVDVQGTHKIWAYIRHLKTHDKTIFVTTNVMGEADALCDEVIILDHGKMICQGTPAALKQALGTATIRLSLPSGAPIPAQVLSERIGAFDLGSNNTIIIAAPNGEQDLARVLQALQDVVTIERIALDQPSLDDVFLSYTGKALRD